MKTKICSKCKIKKSVKDFYKSDYNKDGLLSECKKCHYTWLKIYRIKNKDKATKNAHDYYLKNKNKIKKRYLENKNIICKRARDYYLKNKNRLNKRWCIYYKIHKNKLNKCNTIYKKERRERDIEFRILTNLRTRLGQVLKGNPKLETTMRLVGCSIEFLKVYLEARFKKGMSWKNYGKWHIDHIRPCASFDLSKPSEQRKCFHYTNLQPLWAKENLRKGDKYGK